MLAMAVLLLCTLPLLAQDQPRPIVNTATASGITPPLGELAKLPQPQQYGFHEANPVRCIPKRNFGTSVDPVEQRGSVSPATNYSRRLLNFLGVGNGFPGYTVPDAPPDTNMAVGDTQIVQWVNVSYTVCDKSSPTPAGQPSMAMPLGCRLAGIRVRQPQRRRSIAQFDRLPIAGCYPRMCLFSVQRLHRHLRHQQRAMAPTSLPVPGARKRLSRLSRSSVFGPPTASTTATTKP